MPELKIVVKFDTGKATADAKEYAEGTLGALKRSIANLKREMDGMHTGTEQQVAASKKLIQMQSELNLALGRGIPALHGAAKGSANAAMTMQALNYTIRDSPYFFRDFSLGLLAIGNNLNPLIDGLIKMRIEAGGGGRVLSFLQNNLTGITLAFSIAVSAIQAVTFALAKNKKEVGDTKTEYEKLTEAVKTYSRSKIQAALAEEEAKFTILQKEKDDTDETNRRIREAQKKAGLTFRTPELKFAKQEELDNAKKAVDILYNELTTLGDISEIQRKITELVKEQSDVIDDPKRIQALERQINALKESEKTLRGVDKPSSQENSLKKLLEDLIGTTHELAREMNDLLQAANSANYLMVSAMGAQQVSVGDYRQDAKDRRKKLWDRFGFDNMNDAGKPKLGDAAQEYVDSIKNVNKELINTEQISNTVGNAISNAFINGGSAINMATQALKQFIIQLLVVRSMDFLLKAIFAPASLPTTIAGFLGLSKKTVAQSGSMPATPELSRVISSANSIASRQNSTMVVNVQGELVGSGSNLKAIIKKRDKITAKYY